MKPKRTGLSRKLNKNLTTKTPKIYNTTDDTAKFHDPTKVWSSHLKLWIAGCFTVQKSNRDLRSSMRSSMAEKNSTPASSQMLAESRFRYTCLCRWNEQAERETLFGGVPSRMHSFGLRVSCCPAIITEPHVRARPCNLRSAQSSLPQTLNKPFAHPRIWMRFVCLFDCSLRPFEIQPFFKSSCLSMSLWNLSQLHFVPNCVLFYFSIALWTCL